MSKNLQNCFQKENGNNMTLVDNRKQIAMMKKGEFARILFSAIVLLHEEVMGEPPMEIVEYEKMTQGVIQTLCSRLQSVVKKKKERIWQIDLEDSIEEIKSHPDYKKYKGW